MHHREAISGITGKSSLFCSFNLADSQDSIPGGSKSKKISEENSIINQFKKEDNEVDKIEEIDSDEEKISNFNFKLWIKFYYKETFDPYYVKFKGHDMLLFSKIHVSDDHYQNIFH